MAHESSPKITLESSLKAIEIENFLDRYFYRPIAFRIALLLRHTSVTPNMVTLLSIIVGVTAGIHFYFNDWQSNLIGVFLLIFANTLDCVDGQLARLTGIKSKIGRILDGFAGDLWFISIYLSISFRLMNEGWSPFILAIAIISGMSHSRQASIADYFKNLHLYFLKGAAGSEFDESAIILSKYEQMPWKGNVIEKFFLFFYRHYTRSQENMAPSVFKLRHLMAEKFPTVIPSKLANDFKSKAINVIQWMHILAFNGRTPILFVVVLLDVPALYFGFEIVLLNLALILSIRHYGRISRSIIQSIEAGVYEER
ncbi:MAG: CDP-alcohol phosphatidyltransferase family protein [Bacteroidales bacterium]